MTSTQRARIAAAAASVLLGSSATISHAWQSMVFGEGANYGRAHTVVVDAEGNVFTGGGVPGGVDQSPYGSATIVKHNGANGAELWRSEAGSGLWSSVAIDASGDAFAAGVLEDGGFALIKIDGADGTEIWRQGATGITGFSIAWEVALDSNQDAIAAGVTLAGYPYRENFTVVKVSNANGALLWRTDLLGELGPDNEARLPIVDTNGDVIVTGRLSGIAGARSDFAVVKLSGADGAELWRKTIGGTNADNPATTLDESRDTAGEVRLAPNGDLLVSGYFVHADTWEEGSILRLSAVDGSVLWQRSFEGDEVHGDVPYSITFPRVDQDYIHDFVIDTDGNVLVSGHVANAGASQQFLAKISGADGSDLWFVYPQDSTSTAFIRIALDGAGGFVATGGAGGDLAIAKFSASDGSEDWRVREGTEQEPGTWGDFGVDIDVDGSAVVVGASLDDQFAVISLDLATGDGIGSITQATGQNLEQRACILALQENLADVADAQGERILDCLRDGARQRLATTITECVAAESDSSLAQAFARTLQDETSLCGDPAPDFGYTSGAGVNDAGADESALLWNDVFGADLDTGILLKSADAAGARCQQGVAKALERCYGARLNAFVACKQATLLQPRDIESCMGVDSRDKVRKACGTGSSKVGIALTRKCATVDLVTALPGCALVDPAATASCVSRATQCRACRAINQAGALSRDCDELDDGTVNSSCP